MKTRSYPAIRVKQTSASGALVLFAAPAIEIDDWSGIPQRERLGQDTEAVGFQREENPKRLDALAEFFGDQRNVIQNPLLCASRDPEKVVFEPESEVAGVATGTLHVRWDDLEALPLVELLRRVKLALEARLPGLADQAPSTEKVQRLKSRANSEYPNVLQVEAEGDAQADDTTPVDDSSGEESDGATAALFSNETHIADFWEEVAGRVRVLEEAGLPDAGDTFLGFSKEAMIAYLQPVVVVDGQHRLRGALLAADRAVDSETVRDEIQAAIETGENPDDVIDRIKRRDVRQLPVSLLLESSAAEHVFQFVVVNQKATPIGRALLGTIVSTSLSAEELNEVSERLTAAGIPLEDSQAIAFLTRHPDSPFKGLVEKGLTNEGNDLLQWNVLGALVRIFRELKGGKLYHEKVDYADKWRRSLLDGSGIVSGAPSGTSKLAYWSRQDGPWRDVFIAFWAAVRDKLAVTDDSEAGNYWGAPRRSNLFNKVSLTILAGDFFQFLTDKEYGFDAAVDVASYVDEWLKDVKVTYFARDWKLAGVKKDGPGTRNQWAYLWAQYRKDPVQVPQVATFRQQKA